MAKAFWVADKLLRSRAPAAVIIIRSTFMSLLFLLIVGAGSLSLDALVLKLKRRRLT